MKLKAFNNIPTILVLFGATGDLVSKKIIPALFRLFEKGKLPKMFKVVAFSRRQLTEDQYADLVKKIIQERLETKISDKKIKEFCGFFVYQRGFFDQAVDYKALGGILQTLDNRWGVCTNKLFYLAVPPEYYQTIFRLLANSGLTNPCGPEEGWTRVIVEKPFGKNLTTARELDELLAKLFQEEQIYRVDHYLAKEMIQNILTFRFANNLFEVGWGKDLIERIDIRLLETLGAEDRGAFYDSIGALRDIGQNHLLQILALLTMDHPLTFAAAAVRQKRADALTMLKIPTKEEIKNNSFRAQYIGYQDIAGVSRDSQTETYFKINLLLDSPRWRGVPVMLEGGKRLGAVKKEIVVTLKHARPCLCPPDSKGHYKNKIIFTFDPEERIKIQFWSKKPGLEMAMEERDFDFLFRQQRANGQYIEEYEKLLTDCIIGDQTLFISTEEIKAMWRVIDPIVKYWQAGLVPLATYQPDTNSVLEKISVAKAVLKKTDRQELAIIGLGKMGGNIARRLLEQDWRVVGFNRSVAETEVLVGEGLVPARNLNEVTEKLAKTQPRIFWLMTPSTTVEEILFGKDDLVRLLKKGDIVIDGGNSYYEDSIRRHKQLAAKSIHFLDVGVSGGPSGARHGACLMIGGEEKAFKQVEHLFGAIAQTAGYQFFPGAGAGHFVKMVHNGIEYGMMQAIAEGFAIMKTAPYKIDLEQVADIYNHGSVIESRLTDWLEKAFQLHGGDLKNVSGSVAHTGEGEWTVKTAEKLRVKAKIIEESFKFRVFSQKNPSYAGKILSALREQFGGHSVK